MKERPILFSGQMVRAILRQENPKTQTRRAFNDRTLKLMKLAADAGEVSYFASEGFLGKHDQKYIVQFCPYGKPGDRLWVRESFCDATTGMEGRVLYRADGDFACRWTPSIHMPRWASRITLEITGVRVERLQDITEADAVAEGTGDPKVAVATVRDAYSYLWESINGPGSWEANPWVWVVEFKRVQQ